MKNYVYSRIYKLCRVFSWLIAFFIGGIFYSITCHAQSLPTPTPDTFSTIINGNNSLSFSLFSDVDVLPINPNPVDIYKVIENVAQDPLIVGSQLNLMQNNDYTVNELSQNEIDEFSQVYPYLYDVNGNTVSWDNVYHLHYMNAMFHGDCYIDLDGNILTSDVDNTKSMFQLGVGGYLLQVNDVANIYDQIADQLVAQEYILATSGADLSNYNLSYYLHSGYVTSRVRVEGWIYVPNMYDVGNICISSTQQDGQSAIFYYNNGAQFQYKNITSEAYYNRTGTNTINGVTYNKYIQCNGVIRNDSNSSRTDFNNRVTGAYNFSGTVFDYDTSLLNNIGDTVSFKKIQFPETKKPLQFDDEYDYNSVKQIEQDLNNLNSTPNELFDPSEDVSDENYPLNTPYNGDEVNPSELPFPDRNSNPYPDPNPDPNLEYNSEVQPTPEEVETSINNFGIPFFQNLQYKYPFSIPWDIKAFINSFRAEPTPPAWDFDWSITVGNTTYTHHFQGDLSDFNSLAAIFRNLLLISFIIGLCVFSYNHHF